MNIIKYSKTLYEFDNVVSEKNHVQTPKFWMKKPMIENKLKSV